MRVRWGGISGLQWIQVKDFISPDVRNELQDWGRRRGGWGRSLLTLNSVSDSRDGRRAPPFSVDGCRAAVSSGNTLHLPGGTGSGLCGIGELRRLLVLRWRRRGVSPGQTGPLLQSEELGLPLQSTLLSVPLQGGRVTLRGWNVPTTGPLCVPLRSPLVSLAPLSPGKRIIRVSSSSWHKDVLLARSPRSVPAVWRSSRQTRRRLVLCRDVRSLNSVGLELEGGSFFCLYSSVFVQGG